MNIFKHSIPGLLVVLFRRAGPFCAPTRIGRLIALAWNFSLTRSIWGKFLVYSESVAESSLYRRFLAAFNGSLRRVGRFLEPIWEGCFIHRLAVYGRSKGGFALGVVFRLGSNRCILALMALMLPIDYLLRRAPVIGAFAPLWDDALLLVLFLYCLWRRVMEKKIVRPRPSGVDGAIFLFCAVGFFLLCVNSPSLAIAIDGYRAVVQFIPIFFIASRLLDNEGDLLSFVLPFIAVGGFVALHGIYQYISGTPIPEAWVSQTEMGVRTRAFSILGSPNIMASLLVMTAPLSVGMAYAVSGSAGRQSDRLRRLSCWVFWGIGGLMCLACLFTFSRGGWLGMSVAIVVFAFLRDRRLFILLLFSVTVAIFIPEIAHRITYLFTSDFAEASQTAGRAVRWETGWDLLRRSSFLFGYGLGRFGGAVAMQNQVVEGLRYFYMDNYYLKTLVEMGWVGLGSYLFLLFSALASGLMSLARVRDNPRLCSLAAAFLSAMCGVLTHCFFENIFEVPYMLAYFWMLGGAIVALPYMKQSCKVGQRA